MREIRERLRRWARPGLEAALWTLLAVSLVAELFDDRDHQPFLEATVLVAALAFAAALYRSFPLTCLGVVLTTVAVQTSVSVLLLAQSLVLLPFAALVAVALLAGTRSERVPPVAVMVSAVCAFTFVLYVSSSLMSRDDLRTFLSGTVDWLGGALALALCTLAPWLFGRYRRLYHRLTWGGWEIAERMERTRAAEADRARLRERARIANRMHDSLGHDLALIAIRAAALEMAAEDGARQREAAGALRTAAHEANLRLREIIGVLREDADHDTAPEQVAALVQHASDAGLAVRLVREGPDPDPATTGGRAVHRIVQEALTNAAKYAPGAEVTVRVVREAGRTLVRVSDTGPRTGREGALPARGEEGTGLAGLRSLVEELGGSLRAGAREDTGFTVRAIVPDSGAEGRTGGEADELETRRARGQARERARRRLLTAVAIPLALGLGAALAGFGLLRWVSVNSVLPADRYEELSVGDERERVEEELPRFSYPEGSVSGAPPRPAGAECSFYLVRHEHGLPPVYRLCFAGGVLVDKVEFERVE